MRSRVEGKALCPFSPLVFTAYRITTGKQSFNKVNTMLETIKNSDLGIISNANKGCESALHDSQVRGKMRSIWSSTWLVSLVISLQNLYTGMLLALAPHIALQYRHSRNLLLNVKLKLARGSSHIDKLDIEDAVRVSNLGV